MLTTRVGDKSHVQASNRFDTDTVLKDNSGTMLATQKQTAEFVEFFRLHGVKQTLQKNNIIIRSEETPTGVFYIDQGLVKAYNITKYGEENLLVIRKHDEIFPLIWAITGHDRHVTYQALAPTLTWRVGRQEFLSFIKKTPDALPPLLDRTMDMYKMHGERIFNLEYRTVRERLISFLMTMSDRFGEKNSDGLLIGVPLRHQDIASSINATRETTSREMSALERKGLLINRQSSILLKDIDGLKKYIS